MGLTGEKLSEFVEKQQKLYKEEKDKEREERAKEREDRAKQREHEEKMIQVKAEQEKELIQLKAEQEEKNREQEEKNREQEKQFAQFKAEQEEKMLILRNEEEAKLAKSKAEEEARLAQIKTEEEERRISAKAEEEQRRLRQKTEEEERIATMKAQENAMVSQMKAEQERRRAEEEERKRKLKMAEEKEKMSLRYDLEERKRAQEQETIKMKIEEDDRKRAQELEMMKLKIEYERERARAEMEVLEKKGEVGVVESQEVRGSVTAKAPRLPNFIDGKDDLDAYILRFERFAQTRNWHRDDWAVNLSALLTGEALTVYTRMAGDEAMDYCKVKEALLKRYRLTEDGFRSKFRDSDPVSGESPGQFITRLRNYLNRWMEMAHVEREFDAIYDMIVKEQFVKKCSNDLSVYLKEKSFETLEEMAEQAERFLIAHNKEMATGKDKNRPTTRTSPTYQSYKTVRECFNCRRPGHVRTDCKHKGGGKEVRCTKCSRYGHEAFECKMRKGVVGTTITRRRPLFKKEETIEVQKEQSVEEQDAEKEKPTVSSDEGKEVASQDDEKTVEERMQVMYTKVGEKLVSTLRDTGCSTICVNTKLVDPDQMTGETKIFTFLDGNPREAKVAKIDVDTPFLKKENVEAMCIDDPTFDLVIGEVEGVRCKCNPNPDWKIESVGAVTTRAQEVKRKKQLSPLKVYVQDEEVSVTPEILIKLQKEDETLSRVRDKDIDVKRSRGNNSSYYTIKDDVGAYCSECTRKRQRMMRLNK